jgi:hypothetical protein
MLAFLAGMSVSPVMALIANELALLHPFAIFMTYAILGTLSLIVISLILEGAVQDIYKVTILDEPLKKVIFCSSADEVWKEICDSPLEASVLVESLTGGDVNQFNLD